MSTINTRLLDSLAQVILALSTEEQALLAQKIQQQRSTAAQLQPDLNQFFQSLSVLEPDPEQPSLQEISQEVKAVRRELWAEP